MFDSYNQFKFCSFGVFFGEKEYKRAKNLEIYHNLKNATNMDYLFLLHNEEISFMIRLTNGSQMERQQFIPIPII